METTLKAALSRRFATLVRTLAMVALVAVMWTPTTAQANAPATGRHCAGRPPIVLVHDFATGSTAVAGLADHLRAQGRCVRVTEWGTPALLGDAGVPTQPALGGTNALEYGAQEISGDLRSAGRGRPIDVVGVGAGALVARRALQLMADPPRVRTFVALGPMWDGTNLLGLGDLDQASRDAGSYDLVLGIERLLFDPLCAGCRDVVQHSDFLTRLQTAGIRLPGSRIVDVVSSDDLLVTPYQSGLLPYARNVVVQDVAPGRTVTHYQIPDDAIVRQVTDQALR